QTAPALRATPPAKAEHRIFADTFSSTQLLESSDGATCLWAKLRRLTCGLRENTHSQVICSHQCSPLKYDSHREGRNIATRPAFVWRFSNRSTDENFTTQISQDGRRYGRGSSCLACAEGLGWRRLPR